MPWRVVTIERPYTRRRRVFPGFTAAVVDPFVPLVRRRLIAFEPAPAVGRGPWRFAFLPGVHRGAVSPSIVFTATAVMEGLAFPTHSAAVQVVFTAVASLTTAFAHSAAVQVVFTAVGSQTQTHEGVGSSLIVFTTAAEIRPPATFVGTAVVEIRFRARSRGKRPGAMFADGYLGRYQVGQDVPLQIQCVDSNGEPTQPDAAPLARIYRDGAFVRDIRMPIETDADATGRFRVWYTLGNSDETGHYSVVYLYESFGLARGDSDAFEVVDGGDPSGSVLAVYSLVRPDGDYVLAHLSAGRLAEGQTPYLDEGI